MSLRILHFADAHIDMISHGRRDGDNGLPLRVLDFLKALDTIVNTAVQEKVDLVIFAGDAYKDRTPAPTYQREWGRRIMRLSAAGIPTLLLVGNHDLSPAQGRATALQEFNTLQVPLVRVIDRPMLLGPAELNGLPLQIMAIPWVSRSRLLAAQQENGIQALEAFDAIQTNLETLINDWWTRINPDLPVVMTAHASVQGALYGAERAVMLGGDLVLPGTIVRDPRLAYVALGHIHKPQNLNPDGVQPPIIYPGSIERVDFGEAADDKYFVVAQVENGENTQIEWRKLHGRKFIDRFVRITESENIMDRIWQQLPAADALQDAIVRLIIEYPREWESMIDEGSLRRYAGNAFEFHLIRRPQMESRLRLPENQTISSLSPLELLEMYWQTTTMKPSEIAELQTLAARILTDLPGLEEENV